MLMAAAKQKQKINMDVEALVRWAYVDELSKRQSSAAEGIWDHILDYSNHGGVDSGRGAAQRYAHFGLPDADAERVEKAISALNDTVIDWARHFDELAGDLAGLITINDLSPRRDGRPPKGGWGKRGARAINAFFGQKGEDQVAHDRPRDVLMVGGINTKALLTMHAIKGTRPDWRDEQPTAERTYVPAAGGLKAKIIGECRGKNLYTAGSYCPLVWSPSPLEIVAGRRDYFAWYHGLTVLSETLELERFEALPPKAPRLPWFDASEDISRIIPVMPTFANDVRKWGKLPLSPQRERAGPPRRRVKEAARTIPFGEV
jgi:hypothetical protein